MTRAIYLAAGAVLLLFIFALILAIALNAPVTWLERKKFPRPIPCAASRSGN